MALLPKGSLVSFGVSGATSVLAVDGEISKQSISIDFERKEYLPSYQLSLPESDGSEPILIKNVVGKLIQFTFNCGTATSVRNVGVDDSYVDLALKSFKITRYQIKFGPSSPSDAEQLFLAAVDHNDRIKSFEGYQALFNTKISWQLAQIIQGWNFNYLTSTGLSVSGAGINISDVLIRSYNLGFTHINPTTGLIITKDASITLDSIQIENQRVYIG
jgi:hypothetical protein